MNSLIDANEINELSAKYGAPIVWERTLAVSSDTLDIRGKKSSKRRGEIVLALPRPNGQVLLHTKSFYPPDCYRLPTGGIKLSERVEAAAYRELAEETGLAATMIRLLGVVDYTFQWENETAVFVSYVFLTSVTDQTPNCVDERERITGFREVRWQELSRVADELERLPGEWQDWGVFRSIPHRLVVQAFTDSPLPGSL